MVGAEVVCIFCRVFQERQSVRAWLWIFINRRLACVVRRSWRQCDLFGALGSSSKKSWLPHPSFARPVTVRYRAEEKSQRPLGVYIW